MPTNSSTGDPRAAANDRTVLKRPKKSQPDSPEKPANPADSSAAKPDPAVSKLMDEVGKSFRFGITYLQDQPHLLFAILIAIVCSFFVSWYAVTVVRAPWWAGFLLVVTLMLLLLGAVFGVIMSRVREQRAGRVVVGSLNPEATFEQLRDKTTSQVDKLTPDELIAVSKELDVLDEATLDPTTGQLPDKTVAKLRKVVVNSMPLGRLLPSRGEMRTRILWCVIVATLSIAAVLLCLYLLQPGIPPQELCIRNFYEGINKGLSSDTPDGWKLAWDQLTPARQDAQKTRFPGEYPEHLKTLYDTRQTIRWVEPMRVSAPDREVYYVCYETREGVPENPLWLWLDPQTSKPSADFYTLCASPDRLIEVILDAVKRTYALKSKNAELATMTEKQLEERIRGYLRTKSVAYLFQANCLASIAAIHGLTLVEPDPSRGLRYYDAVWVISVELVRGEDRKWRIDKFATQSITYRPVHEQ